MKIDRTLGILITLLNNEKVKAKDLAEKFEVSIRTIHRDIENICMAGIPIVTYQGGDGGISIAEGYKLDKSLLTNDELNNILVGLKSIESISNDSTNMKLLIEKLVPNQEDIISVSNNLFIDLTSFYGINLSQKINILREAISNKEEVSFEYFSKEGMSQRCIQPYFITFKWSAWYVFGFCKLRNDFRLFKLNRINNLKINELNFTLRDVPEARMQLDNYFTDDGEAIVMLIDRSMEYQIVDSYGVNSYEITEDNRIKFELHYTNYDYAMQYILALRDKVEVLSPKHVIDDLKICAKNILNKYE